MPIYVYKNLTTGETFEVQQRITENALTEHPETGDPVKRLIQPVGIAFKGSGFYVTDSRKAANSASKSSAGSSDATSSAAGAGEASKSETKSEATTSGASNGKSDAGSATKTKAASGSSD